MLTHPVRADKYRRGTTMVEILITIVILAFGLLGLAALQSKMHLGLVESYQRAQAVVLLSDLSERINANGANAAAYVSSTVFGTGDSQPADCSGVAVGAARDECEWSNELKGAAETKASANVGAMTGARGCITQIQAPNPAAGVCTPGVYQITVAWQGLHQTAAPSVTCALNQFGDEKYRRAISARVSVGLPACS